MSTGPEIESPRDGARRLFRAEIEDGFRPAGLHPYTDARGETTFCRPRLKHPDGRKVIRPIRLDGARWVKGEPKAPPAGKSLYGLYALLTSDATIPVWIVEGEGCADALTRIGLVATTSGSASSADSADWGPLRGRHCIIWADNDTAGRIYGEAAADHLRALGCTVETMDIAPLGLPDKGDCVDWIAAHPDATADDLRALRRTLLFSHGDSGGSGDSARPNALDAPTAAPEPSKVGTASGRFEVKHAWGSHPSGVYWIGYEYDKDSEEDVERPPEWVCSRLDVVASTRDSSGSEWGRLLVFRDRDGREHRWAMPMTMLATDGAEMRTELLRQGVEVSTLPGARRRLLDYVQSARPGTTARCVTRTGWHRDAYVLPARVFNDGAEPIIYQARSLDGVSLAQGGTMEGWREGVAVRCAGHSRLVLALSAAFAGPCLGLLGDEGGGFHLRGGSSQGKSTALYVAGSVYGPKEFVRTWRATDNALEGVASIHSDMLLPLDELGQIDPRHAGAAAYMLANGQGKSRAGRAGEVRSSAHWRVLFLSSGEKGMSDLMAEAGHRQQAGQEVRVIDIPADAQKGAGLFDFVPEGVTAASFAEGIKGSALAHYGHALPAFIEKIAEGVEWSRSVLREMQAESAQKLAGPDADGQVRRVAMRFGLVAAAGALASHFHLTGWDVDESQRAVEACFQAWMDARGTRGNSEPMQMVAQVRACLEAHGDSRFTPWNASLDSQRTINRLGWRRNIDGEAVYLIYQEQFKREICKGFDHKLVARALRDIGALKTEGAHYTIKPRLPDGSGHQRMYAVTAAIWESQP